MPTLTPDLIRAVLHAGEDDPPPTGYVPTAEDTRRAAERVRYASTILHAVDGSPVPALVAAHNAPTVEALSVARAALKARPDRSSDAVRLARILLIDASRILAGAADAVPV